MAEAARLLNLEEVEYLRLVAHLHLTHHKWDKAWSLYQALLVVDPENPDVHKGLSVAGFQLGKHSDALANADRWLQAASSDEERRWVLVHKARILGALGEVDQAREHLGRAMEMES